MTVATRYTTGGGTTGAHMFIRSRNRKSSGDISVGVMYMPGGNGSETTWQAGDATTPDNANLVLHRLVQDSYSFRIITMHTDWDWGNSTVTTRMNDAFAQAANYNFSLSRIHIVAASMGTVCALNYAKAHPSLIASLSLMLPVVDLDDIEANNRVGQYGFPQPSTAYGGTIPDASNPIENAASFTSFPIGMWGTTDDTICIYSRATAFASAVNSAGGNCVMNSLGAAGNLVLPGHSLEDLNIQDVVDFVVDQDTPTVSDGAPVVRKTTAGRGQ